MAKSKKKAQAAAPAQGAAQTDSEAALALAKELRAKVFGRLQADGRWKSLALDRLRDDMFRECRSKAMEREAAMNWVYGELDRLYPPLPQPDSKAAPDQATGQAGDDPQPDADTQASRQDAGNVSPANQEADRQGMPPAEAPARTREGLGQIPADWPELPPNATLSAEIAWVQAERLRIVDERPNGSTVVHLERARSPAPSWSALSWLETSIRSYAKYVEVAAKAASTGQDEQDQVRAERMQLDEIRALLAEMV